MSLYEQILQERNLLLAGECLLAARRGDDTPEARAGILLIAQGILALIPGRS